MAEAEKKCAKRRFLDFLAQKNLRLTAQRQVIIDTAFSTEEHFTAEQLLAWSRERDRSVSRAGAEGDGPGNFTRRAPPPFRRRRDVSRRGGVL